MESFLIKVVSLYQRWSKRYPSGCRFVPSCSEYFKLAVKKYGALRGSLKGLKRILRCGPWVAGEGMVDYP